MPFLSHIRRPYHHSFLILSDNKDAARWVCSVEDEGTNTRRAPGTTIAQSGLLSQIDNGKEGQKRNRIAEHYAAEAAELKTHASIFGNYY